MAQARGEMKRGFLWLGTAATVVRVIDVCALLLALVRLDDRDIGQASIAWTVAVVLEAWNGGGIGAAVLNAKHLPRRSLDTAFFSAAGAGMLLCAIAAALAPVVVHVYDDPTLLPLVVVSGAKLVAVSTASVPLARLGRALRFETIAAVQIMSTLLAAIVRVALAYAGTGAWALVAAHAFHGFAQLLFVYVLAPYWPRLRFDMASARALLRFGAATSGADMVQQVSRNVDYLLVGHFLGLSALGVYRVVFEIAMEPIMAIGDVIARTASRVLCRLRASDPELSRTFLWTVQKLGLALVPVAAVLLVAFEPILSLLGRATSDDIAIVSRVLVIAALLRALVQLLPMLVTALGRPDLALRFALVSLVWLTTAITLGLSIFGDAFGLAPIAFAWLLAPVLVASVAIPEARALAGIGPRAILRAFTHLVDRPGD